MSTKTISQTVVPAVLKNTGFAMLVLMGWGGWQMTKMSPDQVDTLRAVVEISDCLVGYIVIIAFFSTAFVIVSYSLFFHPAGIFVGKFVMDLQESQREQGRQMRDHIEGSKATHGLIVEFRNDVEQSFKEVNVGLEKYQ